MCYPAIQQSTLSAAAEPLYNILSGTMFSSPVYIDFFGIPIISVDYTGTVIPVILAVWFASKCEKLFNKFVPDLVKFFFVPMLTLLVTPPVTILFLGPVAIFFKTKDKQLKEMTIPNFISGIFGVTEPAIYGILLPLKKPFIISCIAGGIGGAFYGHFNFRKFILGGMGIFELPNMMNPDGTMGNIIVAFVGIAITMVIAFILTMLFYKDKEPAAVSAGAGAADGTANVAADAKQIAASDSKTQASEATQKAMDKAIEAEQKEITIASPLKGRLVKLSDVQDEAFSSGILGQGVAVLPEEGALYAPADGTISAFFPTGHAIGMMTVDGVELLMHVGMDTVQLEGKGFTPLAKAGDVVKKGQKLLEFDMELIKDAGFSLVTSVLVSNYTEFAR